MPRVCVLNGLCTSCNDRYCFEPVGGVGVCRPCRQALADRPLTDRSPRRNKSKRDKGGSGATPSLDDYYANLDPGDRQRHLEAVARVMGAAALVKCGAGGKPSIAVLTSAVASCVDNWDAIGATVAVHDFPAIESGQLTNPDRRRQVVDLLERCGDLSRLVDRDLNVEMNEEGATGLGLTTGAINTLFDQEGWRRPGGALEITAPMTLQILKVGEPLDGVDGPWARSILVTDGVEKILCYPFTQCHSLLEGGDNCVVTIHGGTLMYVPDAPGQANAKLLVHDMTLPDRGNPDRPTAPVVDPTSIGFPRPAVERDLPPPPAPFPIPGHGDDPEDGSYVAEMKCNGCNCRTVEAADTGTHVCAVAGPGCVLSRVQIPHWRQLMLDCKWTSGNDLSAPSPRELRLAEFFWWATNLYKVQGGGNRCVLPLCVVAAVRCRHPNPPGVAYTDTRTDGGVVVINVESF